MSEDKNDFLEKSETLKVEMELVVTNEDIDDIMTGVMEGGINYWCDEVSVVGDYLGEYASEQISRGGQLILHDIEEDETYTLDREKFMKGLKMYFEKTHPYDILEEKKGSYVCYRAGWHQKNVLAKAEFFDSKEECETEIRRRAAEKYGRNSNSK